MVVGVTEELLELLEDSQANKNNKAIIGNKRYICLMFCFRKATRN
jgi:hypothetical protein